MFADQNDHQKRVEPISYTRQRRSFSTFLRIFRIIISLIGIILCLNQLFHQTSPSTSVPKRYPAFLVSTIGTPASSPPYTSETVFRFFQTTGKPIRAIISSNGWECCVTYQPEGKLIGWQESYGVELEIATFATPVEAKTDASDLLKSSAGFSVFTRNLCLFFYDNSISKAQFAEYSAVLLKACS